MQRVSPSGKPLGIADHSYCVFDLEPSKGLSLADALALHANQLLEHKRFLEELKNTGGTVEFFVGWFIERYAGDVFQADLLERMGAIGIDLTLEVYGSDEKTFDPQVVDIHRTPS